MSILLSSEALRDRAIIINLSGPEGRVYSVQKRDQLLAAGIPIRERRTAVGTFNAGYPSVRGFADIFDEKHDLIREGGKSLFYHRLDHEPVPRGQEPKMAVPSDDAKRVMLREQLLSSAAAVPDVVRYSPPAYWAEVDDMASVELNARPLDLKIAMAVSDSGLITPNYPAVSEDTKVEAIDLGDNNELTITTSIGRFTFKFAVPIVSVGEEIKAGDSLAQPVNPAKVMRQPDLIKELTTAYGRDNALAILQELREATFLASKKKLSNGSIVYPVEYLDSLADLRLHVTTDVEQQTILVEDLVGNTGCHKVKRDLYSTVFLRFREKSSPA